MANDHFRNGRMEDPQSTGPGNTVRMNSTDLTRLHAEIDGNGPNDHARRAHFRWNFRTPSVRIEMHQPGGVQTNLHYAARNLSGTGLGILHNSYVHVGTRCTVHLPSVNGVATPVPARVVRCRHVKGLVHEVGIQFVVPVNVRDFIPLDPLQGAFTLENVDPERLTGSILHIDDSAMDRRLVRHFLKETSLNIVAAEDAATALTRVSEGFDLILCDYEMPDVNGPELIEKMRNAGVQTPVIMVSADQREGSREHARNARVNAYVYKPLVREKLLRAIAEFLVLESSGADSGGPIFSSLKTDDPSASFIPEFIEELRGTAQRLNKAMQDDDLKTIKRICFQIKGSAAGLGFGPLADAAEQVMNCINATMSVTESIRPIRNLSSMCARLRAREPDRKAG